MRDLHEYVGIINVMTDVSKRDLRSYREFLRYFDNLREVELNEHHLVIAANFTYGWMPRTLKWKTDNFAQAVEILNRARASDTRLSQESLASLAELIDNSMVAVSKLLHFVRPDKYVAWDSQVSLFLLGKVHRLQFDEYLDYLIEVVDKVTNDHGFEKIHTLVKEKIGEVGKGRALEWIMYRTGLGRNIKNPQPQTIDT